MFSWAVELAGRPRKATARTSREALGGNKQLPGPRITRAVGAATSKGNLTHGGCPPAAVKSARRR